MPRDRRRRIQSCRARRSERLHDNFAAIACRRWRIQAVAGRVRADGISGRSNSACSPGRNAGEETEGVGWCGFMGRPGGVAKSTGGEGRDTMRQRCCAMDRCRSRCLFGTLFEQLYKTKLYGSIIWRRSVVVNTAPGSSSARGDRSLPRSCPFIPLRRNQCAAGGARSPALHPPLQPTSAAQPPPGRSNRPRPARFPATRRCPPRPARWRRCTPSGRGRVGRDGEGRAFRQIGSRPGRVADLSRRPSRSACP